MTIIGQIRLCDCPECEEIYRAYMLTGSAPVPVPVHVEEPESDEDPTEIWN